MKLKERLVEGVILTVQYDDDTSVTHRGGCESITVTDREGVQSLEKRVLDVEVRGLVVNRPSHPNAKTPVALLYQAAVEAYTSGPAVVDVYTLTEMIREYYDGSGLPEGEDRPTGGYLHIVTDDYNVEARHIIFCWTQASDAGDNDAMLIAQSLLEHDYDVRDAICRNEYARPEGDRIVLRCRHEDPDHSGMCIKCHATTEEIVALEDAVQDDIADAGALGTTQRERSGITEADLEEAEAAEEEDTHGVPCPVYVYHDHKRVYCTVGPRGHGPGNTHSGERSYEDYKALVRAGRWK